MLVTKNSKDILTPPNWEVSMRIMRSCGMSSKPPLKAPGPILLKVQSAYSQLDEFKNEGSGH
jgi:hypothetical protein